MSDVIQLLPDAVANQIAAGEVIQRPASVLKELVENAIDAGADFIQIVIKDAGRTLIQVTDNGKGMSETDARMSFERHATSKIRDAADIFSLRTMGFRGEALASIAAVAQVKMRTRPDNEELGTMIEIAGTRVFRQETVQCEKGTTFLIKNLFFNVPARRRFLKSDNVEKSHILNEFYRIALVNSEVEFSFYDGDEEIFRLPASNIKVRIENIFGKNQKKKLQQQLLSIESQSGLVSIYGFTGRPEFAQKSSNQYFFVNGRYMRHPYFHKAVMMAYHQMIQPNDNPSYFIYFEVDTHTIDINIHPTKTEIKFENEQAIWSILNATIKESLGKFNVVPSIDFDRDDAVDIPVITNPENVRPPQTNFNPAYNPFNSTSYKRPALDWEKLYGGFEEQKNSPSAPAFETKTEPEQQNSVTSFSSLETEDSNAQLEIQLGDTQSGNFQLKNRYIITGIKSGMMMIDQHRAHVRILFEEYMQNIEQQRSPSQQLLFPEALTLSDDDRLWFVQIEQSLRSVGFDFTATQDQNYELTGIPSHFHSQTVTPLLQTLINNARHTATESADDIHKMIALSLANASALKTGQSLSTTEMADLIDRLFACNDPNRTPDGKIITSIWTQDEIAQRFK
ncbi:MAG: DNA mismatch repair endonuclease MutL [Paludibacteraceae bacterium]|nr:DNA mismatch repair endonuclease MutL [Paludibacteraceae bacterium]